MGDKDRLILDVHGLRIPPRADTIEALAWSRFPNDEQRREDFKRCPGRISLSGAEIIGLRRLQLARERFERLDAIEARCHEILKADGDPRQPIARRLLVLAARITHEIKAGRLNVTDEVEELERLCSKADRMILIPAAERGRKFSAGRRRGARSALGRALVEIIRDDKWKSTQDVLEALAKKKPLIETVVTRTRSRKVDRVFKWRDPMSGKVKRTTGRSIATMLTSIRKQVRRAAPRPP
jgi:hypothetical protein